MTEATKPKDVWLVVGNGMNWGKGKTFLGAFINCMKHDSNTYPTTVLHVRKLTPPADWLERQHPERAPGVKLTDADFWSNVYVDEMGSGTWPIGAIVQKADVGGSGTNEKSEPLALKDEVAAMLKKWRAFREEWDEVVCTETMDEAFGGDANEGEV